MSCHQPVVLSPGANQERDAPFTRCWTRDNWAGSREKVTGYARILPPLDDFARLHEIKRVGAIIPCSDAFHAPLKMSTSATPNVSPRSQSWLDRTAIFLAVLCGIHCLATPILLVALPLLANTVWVSEHFHLGMLLLVFPTSLLAAFTGCRQHRDRFVMGFILAGVAVLSVVTFSEVKSQFEATGHGANEVRFAHEGSPNDSAAHQDAAGCASCCAIEPGNETTITSAGRSSIWTGEALLNSLGGLLLVMGHTRNFLLCRHHKCDHRCEG